jgi:hypothetical protein
MAKMFVVGGRMMPSYLALLLASPPGDFMPMMLAPEPAPMPPPEMKALAYQATPPARNRAERRAMKSKRR